jgi:hypothetical protein
VYEVTTDEQSQQQIDALPAAALASFAEARAALELAPGTVRCTTGTGRTAQCGR